MHRFEGLLLAFRIDVHVDVGAERERRSPVAEGESGIEFSGFLERRNGLLVIERIDVTHPLIEPLLRFGVFRRDRNVETAET